MLLQEAHGFTDRHWASSKATSIICCLCLVMTPIVCKNHFTRKKNEIAEINKKGMKDDYVLGMDSLVN